MYYIYIYYTVSSVYARRLYIYIDYVRKEDIQQHPCTLYTVHLMPLSRGFWSENLNLFGKQNRWFTVSTESQSGSALKKHNEATAARKTRRDVKEIIKYYYVFNILLSDPVQYRYMVGKYTRYRVLENILKIMYAQMSIIQ